MSINEMTSAEFTNYRALTGLSIDELSTLMTVRPDQIRTYEQGHSLVAEKHAEFMTQLVADHNADLEELLATDGPIELGGYRPASWYIALGTRIAERDPTRRIIANY